MEPELGDEGRLGPERGLLLDNALVRSLEDGGPLVQEPLRLA